MEKRIGIWIDLKKAYIIDNEEKTIQKIESKLEDYTIEEGYGSSIKYASQGAISESDFFEQKKHQTKAYFDEILDKISDATKIIVFGPGKIKNKFKTELESNSKLRDKPVSIKSVENLSEDQMAAFVRLFFEE